VRAASCHALGSTRKRKRVTTQVVLLFVVPCESESLLDPCARLLAEAELKRQSVRVGDDEPILTEPLVRPPAPAVWISGRGAQAGYRPRHQNGQR